MFGVTRQNALLNAMRTLARPLNQQQTQTSAQTSALPQADEETLKRLKEMREQANSISKTLEQSKTDVAESRKQAAKEKLDMIQKALRMLRQFGGDPKAMAREGARLARELAAAVKEYAAAGGKDAGGASPAPSAASAPAQAQTQAQAAEGAKPQANADGAAETAAEIPAEGTDQADADQTGADPDAAGSEDSGQQGSDQAGAHPNASTPGHTESKGEGKDQDAEEFAKAARDIARKLKSFIEQQKDAMKARRGPGDEQGEHDAKAGLEEIKQTDRILSDLSGGGAKAFAAINIMV